MAFKTFFCLALFASTVSMILSIPQLNNLQVQEPSDSNLLSPGAVPDNLPNINPRTFGSCKNSTRVTLMQNLFVKLTTFFTSLVFNLSAYLQGAPTNSAALNFIPLITILSAALGG
ncbi:unnamed protein product [Orchesella dallaii]|uniref:Uncharacterized protein n=1 Tax=Orchesella dallaii TaxID=48710 RepID=A0ABP1RF47_9HEXA